MAKLDEYKGMAAVDGANDLLYIVDSSEGVVANGSRNITHSNFEQTLDLATIPRSFEGTTSFNRTGVTITNFEFYSDVNVMTLTGNVFLIPGLHLDGRLVTFIIPPNAFNLYFVAGFNYKFTQGGYDRTRTNILKLYCRKFGQGLYEYEVSFEQE